MFLYFNTLGDKKTIKVLGAKKDNEICFFAPNNSQEHILLYLNKLQKRAGFDLKDIKGIMVNQGPGSFAGIRKILTIVNVMGWCLQIPVQGVSLEREKTEEEAVKKALAKIKRKKTGSFAMPVYKI